MNFIDFSLPQCTVCQHDLHNKCHAGAAWLLGTQVLSAHNAVELRTLAKSRQPAKALATLLRNLLVAGLSCLCQFFTLIGTSWLSLSRA